MPDTFKGESVTILRPATPEDAGFSYSAGDQVLIRMSDGTEKIVARSDIRDSGLIDPPATVEKETARTAAKPKANRKLVATNRRKQDVHASRYHRH